MGTQAPKFCPQWQNSSRLLNLLGGKGRLAGRSVLGRWSASYSDPGVSGLADAIKTIFTGSCSSSRESWTVCKHRLWALCSAGSCFYFQHSLSHSPPFLCISKIPSSCFYKIFQSFFLFFLQRVDLYSGTPDFSSFLFQGKSLTQSVHLQLLKGLISLLQQSFCVQVLLKVVSQRCQWELQATEDGNRCHSPRYTEFPSRVKPRLGLKGFVLEELKSFPFNCGGRAEKDSGVFRPSCPFLIAKT